MPIKNGSGCGLSSAQKKQPTFLHIKHDYPYIFQNIILFSLHNVRRELSCRSRHSFMDMFSKETWIKASMNEASSMPKGMTWSVVCVFKAFLTIYPCPVVRSMQNTEDRVQNFSLLFTNGTRYNVIQHSVYVLERRGSSYNSL